MEKHLVAAAAAAAAAVAGERGASSSEDLVPFTPPKKRRLRAAATTQKLWQRTRWSTLAGEDELDTPTACSSQAVPAPSGNVAAVEGVPLAAAELSEFRVKELIDGALKEQLAVIIGVFREGFANVVTKQYLTEHVGAGLEALETSVERMGKRVQDLEVGAEAKKEGLRGRIDRLSTKLNQELGVVQERLREVEAVVFDEVNEDGFGRQDAMKDADADEWERRAARCLEFFRASLSVGMAVHLSGLESRPGLNGKAAVLTGWHEESQRWAVLVGEEQVRVRKIHIVP